MQPRRSAVSVLALFALAGAFVLSRTVDAAEFAGSATEIHPLLIGADVPNVMVRTVGGETVNLHETIGTSRTVLIFIRGGW